MTSATRRRRRTAVTSSPLLYKLIAPLRRTDDPRLGPCSWNISLNQSLKYASKRVPSTLRSIDTSSNVNFPSEILCTTPDPASGWSMVPLAPSVSPVTLVTGHCVPSISTTKPLVR